MNEASVGCLLVLLLVALVLIINYWPVVVGVLILLAVVGSMMQLAEGQLLHSLRRITASADQRLRGQACWVGEGHAMIETISTTKENGKIKLAILLARVSRVDGQYSLVQDTLTVDPPVDVNRIAGHLAFSRFLQSRGLELIDELAVEAKAIKAAVACLLEAEWASESSLKLQGLIDSAQGTLAKAQGNELLEPSIPRLKEALVNFEDERQKLGRYRKESLSMLRKLDDFLSVPEALRPILTFDLDHLYDPQRLQQLQSSFSEVVTLNEVYTELSRDKLA